MSGNYTIIGLSGYAGTGKDTVRALLEELGYVGLAFADPIRSMLRELLTSNGIDDSYIDERALKETPIPQLGVSYRHMAQTLGTEWGRSLHPDFWTRLAGAYMDDLAGSERAAHFVISDVRFANEAEWVRDHGGVIWRIERAAAQPVRAHASESAAITIGADEIIDNNGTLDDLRAQLSNLLYNLA